MWIAAGTYIDTSEATIAGSVSIYGGFDGTETNLSQRDVDANPVYLDGDDSHRVLKITAGPVTLDGLTIQNGYGPNQTASGGGIHKDGAFLLTLNNCRVVDNRPYTANTRYGGGAYFKSGSVVIEECFFANPFVSSGDMRYRRGYGFYAESADVVVIDSIFSNHIDTTTGYYNWGAAIHVYGGSLTVSETDFLDNKVTQCNYNNGGGGAVYIQGNAEAAFTNCLFSGNEVQAGSNRENPGGAVGIYNTGAASVRFDHCTFLNSKGTYGGAIYLRDGDLVLEHCTVAGNYARTAGSKSGQGGAVYVDDGSVTVHNSILWNNTADLRGADIANEGGTSVDINYCNLSGDPSPDTYVWDGAVTVSEADNQYVDPKFASASDVHLNSQEGRWNPGTSSFVTDAETSLCIDAAEPGGLSTYTNEVQANGARANLGRYGNTAEASKTFGVTPIVTNRGSTVVFNQATMKGELIINDATANITFYYDTSDKGEFGAWTDSESLGSAQQTGAVFQVVVNGLAYNTTYFFRAFATNASGYHWAQNPQQFTTGSEPVGGGPEIIHVWSGAPGGQSGLNWFDAYQTIQDAVDGVKGPTNEIWTVYTNAPDGVTVTIATNVSIYGGFVGTETLRSQRTANRTLLDGNYPTDSRRVISVTDGTVLLDGLVISNGYRTGAADHGIGLYASGYDNLTLQSCTFVDNDLRVSGQDGGGAYLSGGTAVISNCLFSDNTLNNTWWHEGGALRAANVALTVVDSVFSNNTYSGSIYYCEGGAMFVSGGTLSMSGCTLVGNGVPKGHKGTSGNISGGGAIHLIDQVIADISNCVFLDNDCEVNATYQASGGALEVNEAGTTATVINCTFAYNDAYDGGALAMLGGGDIVLKNSILWMNTAAGFGQEMYVDGAGSTVTSRYSSVSGTSSTYAYTTGGGTVSWGPGILVTNPLFASASDLHLQSLYGRVDEVTQTIVQDEEQSPAIDAGDPLDNVGLEPKPNGFIINLGAYGGTTEASLSSFGLGGSLLLFE